MRVLVTGASGFIGDYVLNYLVQNTNCDVVATSRCMESVREKSWFSKVKYFEADLYNKQKNYFNFFCKPDMLIHLAWSNLPNYSEGFHITENLVNDLIFLDNIMDNGLKQLVVTGTCLEYGFQEGELLETAPTFPQNPYALAKDALRKYLEFRTNDRSVRFLWLRLFYMFGAGQSPVSLVSQLDAALRSKSEYFNMSGGEQVRDYLPVESVAEFIVKCSLNLRAEGIINIASGSPVKLVDFIRNYLNSKGLDIKLNLGFYPYSEYEPMSFWGNNEKLKSLI